MLQLYWKLRVNYSSNMKCQMQALKNDIKSKLNLILRG